MRHPAPLVLSPLLRLPVALALALTAGGCRPPATPPPPPSGLLTLLIEPPGPGIQVVIDGELAFELPADGRMSLRLEPASHRVQIERDGYYSVWRIVEVPPPPVPAELKVVLHEVLE